MDHPFYTVTVSSLSRGWSYSATEGDTPDPADPVHLTDPLTYSWAFKSEVIPGQLDVFTANVNLAGKTADALPEVQVGDLITLDVRVGTTGPRIIAPPPFRAAEPVVALTRGTYPARMTIPLSDLSVDWRSRGLGSPLGQPNTYQGGDRRDARPYWRERGAEMAVLGALSLGCPTWWGNYETPVSTATDEAGTYVFALAYDGWGPKMYDGALADVLEKYLNSHQPGGYTHTWATVHDAGGHPSGYRRIGPDTWKNAGAFGPGTSVAVPAGGALADPAGPVRVEAVPATRKLPAGAGLPLEFEVADGVLELVPRDSSDIADSSHSTQAALDAEWCVIPATARRARDSVTNTLNVLGYGSQPTGEVDGSNNPTYSDAEYARTYADAGDANSRGPLARDLPTMLSLGLSTSGTFSGSPAVAAAVANFLSDPTALEASWSYDAFTVLSSLIPQDVAAWLLPIMAPRLPGETDGDGRLVRNVTIFDLAANLRFGGNPVTGFVTAGTLTIAGGDMVWQLRTAPGRPIYTGGTVTPITVGQVDNATWQDHPAGAIDPLITVADLAYVDGSAFAGTESTVPSTVTATV